MQAIRSTFIQWRFNIDESEKNILSFQSYTRDLSLWSKTENGNVFKHLQAFVIAYDTYRIRVCSAWMFCEILFDFLLMPSHRHMRNVCLHNQYIVTNKVSTLTKNIKWTGNKKHHILMAIPHQTLSLTHSLPFDFQRKKTHARYLFHFFFFLSYILLLFFVKRYKMKKKELKFVSFTHEIDHNICNIYNGSG